jgi:hypothetical protein
MMAKELAKKSWRPWLVVDESMKQPTIAGEFSDRCEAARIAPQVEPDASSRASMGNYTMRRLFDVPHAAFAVHSSASLGQFRALADRWIRVSSPSGSLFRLILRLYCGLYFGLLDTR